MMVNADHELILRFLPNDGIRTYRPPLKKLLNNFMSARRKMDPEETTRLRDLFLKTITAAVAGMSLETQPSVALMQTAVLTRTASTGPCSTPRC